ncbi:hypothetical protein V5O48_005022 [Marasmius crinis-equi]|uniref:GST C-terminal domain-containing protein n=1 Tax=Marasmius crinis-equi TaxID=585013 RepID=A0ABR3FNW5_9AGAR
MAPTVDTGKPYNLECTGIALETVKEHTAAQDVTLYGQCFCPFTQHEVDHTNRPEDFLEVSPKGLVPGLSFQNPGGWKGLSESSVMLEYLNDEGAKTTGRSLLPPPSNPYARSLVRLQCDHISRTLVPSFFRYVFTQEPQAQRQAGKEWNDSLETLVSLFERSEKEILNNKSGDGAGLGLWIEGNDQLSLTDVLVAPFLYRATNVLKHYRDYEMPGGKKFKAYVTRLINHPAFKKTCSTDDLYIDSYERYAFNRPNPNGQLQNAMNAGKGIP